MYMSGIERILRAVAREKSRAAGTAWRRLHRVESLLTLALGRIRSMGRQNIQRRGKTRRPLGGSTPPDK